MKTRTEVKAAISAAEAELRSDYPRVSSATIQTLIIAAKAARYHTMFAMALIDRAYECGQDYIEEND